MFIMAPIREHDQVVLTTDLPEHGLKAGDVGTVVLVHRGGEGFEIEFFSLAGETIDVATVTASQVRPIEESDVTHARKLAG